MAGSKTTDYSILSFVDGVIPSAARNLALSTSREAESREVEKFLTPRLLDSRLIQVLNSSTLDSRLLDLLKFLTPRLSTLDFSTHLIRSAQITDVVVRFPRGPGNAESVHALLHQSDCGIERNPMSCSDVNGSNVVPRPQHHPNALTFQHQWGGRASLLAGLLVLTHQP